MADVPGDRSTTATVTIDSTTTDRLETVSDHDWFKIYLTAGQSISVALSRIGPNGLEDPYLRVRDSSGTLLFENDDGGGDRNSALAFSASYSGTYYIDVSAWNEASDGDYVLSVSPYLPPPLWTNDQIAHQLVYGYWGGVEHRFDVSQGGSLAVNLTALTSAGQFFAREALAVWSDIIGVTFTEVPSGGRITFDDIDEGAYSDTSYSGGIISSSHVNVNTSWISSAGSNLDSYAFQAYVHEIGHALGLGHAGNYDNQAGYPYDAMFLNDAWSTTVMSYFDQRENTHFAAQGFTFAYALTPMIGDILAMADLYGLSTSTRAGNTTYGFNSNAGRPIYDAAQYPGVAYTIFDSGGADTLNYSGYSASQTINLNPEAFFNVGGGIGNVSIARGVVIENAIGGSGNDEIIGNSVANALSGGAGADRLTGGAGADLFYATAAGFNGDTIVDFVSGDRIQITDANPASFSFSLSGSVLSYTGGSLTFGSAPAGRLVAGAAANGGVELTLTTTTAPARDGSLDFNGDGRDDILWRHDSGTIGNWLGTASGGFVINDASLTSVPTSWRIAGRGDFNGDGRGDILWRHDSGTVGSWLGTASGGFLVNDSSLAQVATSWRVVGTGDFNGDGRDDILWRHDSGTVGTWLGTASGGFADNGGSSSVLVGLDWHVVGTGDFNGDGRDDVLWRNSNGALTNWLGTASGGFADNSAGASSQAPTSWHVAGTADFNGDGRDDILWRHDSGTTGDWLATAGGGFVVNGTTYEVPTSWRIAGSGDFNGDGRDDILWRHDSGTIGDWLGTPSGGFVINDANSTHQVPTVWQLQFPDEFWV